MTKAAIVVVIRHTEEPSPKQQDLQQKVSCWMDKVQGPAKLSTPPCEVEDYYSSDSSLPSLKQLFQSETEAESSKTVVRPVMTIGTNNLEEEMATMKAMLERLVREGDENKVRIKLQEEKITRLTIKLKKLPAQYLAKSSETEEEEEVSVQSEAFDEEVHSKKAGKPKNCRSSSLLTAE